MTANALFVVPRSIPRILLLAILSASIQLCRLKLLDATNANEPEGVASVRFGGSPTCVTGGYIQPRKPTVLGSVAGLESGDHRPVVRRGAPVRRAVGEGRRASSPTVNRWRRRSRSACLSPGRSRGRSRRGHTVARRTRARPRARPRVSRRPESQAGSCSRR